MNYCEYKVRREECTAPETFCEHWQGTFCDLDMENRDAGLAQSAAQSPCKR